MTDRMRDAARARSAEGSRYSHLRHYARPSERRNHEGERHGPVLVRGRLVRAEVRGASSSEGPLAFEGIASVTGEQYEMWDWYGPYAEVVDPGAFADTLAMEGLDVPLVLQHDPMRRLARTVNAESTLELEELTEGEVTGLRVVAPSLDRDDPDVAYIVPKLRSGLIDEMSFRFSITKGQWSPDWMEYHIQKVDIHRGDVAIVGYGANPATTGSLRSRRLASVSRGTPAALTRLRLALADDDL